jgi:spermidine synthase
MSQAEDRPSAIHLLRFTVLLCGGVGMVLELAGSRLLAPFFGNGLFVWTALIGIMLGFMSLGNYLGGRTADKILSRTVLFWVLVGSAASIGVISFIEPVVLPALASVGSVRVAAVSSTIVLFGVPCTLLGMVTPYSTRYALTSLAHSGATVGSLFALGTLGSIIGTFVGGFYVIAWVGSHSLIAWLALLPLILAVFFMGRRQPRHIAAVISVAALVVLAMTATASPIASFDTGYDRYFVDQGQDPETGRRLLILARDYESMESAVYADTGEPYVFDYYRYYDLALAAASADEPVGRTLLIGGGTFSYPRHQLQGYPESATDVVEIDPKLVDVAREQFSLTEDARMDIFLEDGRTFLNRVTDTRREGARLGAYDVVLIDAFKSANSIPYPLTTRQSMQMCYDVLDDEGVLVMNMIASPTGAGSRFVAAQLLTIESVFPQADIFAVYDVDYTETAQNISIIASKTPAAEASLRKLLDGISPELTARRIDRADLPSDVRMLTDDFAPVDQYLMDI